MPEEEERVMSQFEQDVRTGAARFNREGNVYATTSWATVDLEPYKRGEVVVEPPAFMLRSDGKALIYPKRPHVFFGESESLKSWAALLACRSVVAAGYNAVYVDMEDSEPSFVAKCRTVGIPEGAIGGALSYIRPIESLAGDAREDFWLYALDQVNPALVVLDGVTELYDLQGWDINKATDAAAFHKLFAFRGLCASIAIDHTAKDAGRGVLGSQHKRAGLDGAEYEFKSEVRGGREGLSVAKVSVTKDRHGYIREWTKGFVGKLEVDDRPDSLERGVFLKAPQIINLDPRDSRVERVVEWVRENPGSSRAAVQRGTGIGTDELDEALASADVQGLLRNEGTSTRHSWTAS